MKTVLLLLVLCVSVAAQTPAPVTEDDLRRSMAELQAVATDVKVEVKALRLEQLETKNALQRQLLDLVEQRLAVEQKKSVKLVVSYEGAQRQIESVQVRIKEMQISMVDGQAMIKSLTIERDKLARKIERANNRLGCEVLHIGCIGKK